MCVYVCIYIYLQCVCMCVYVCIYIYISNVYVCIYIYIWVWHFFCVLEKPRFGFGLDEEDEGGVRGARIKNKKIDFF